VRNSAKLLLWSSISFENIFLSILKNGEICNSSFGYIPNTAGAVQGVTGAKTSQECRVILSHNKKRRGTTILIQTRQSISLIKSDSLLHYISNQFHQHFTSSFCANILLPKNIRSQTAIREMSRVKCWQNWHLNSGIKIITFNQSYQPFFFANEEFFVFLLLSWVILQSLNLLHMWQTLNLNNENWKLKKNKVL